MIAFQSLECSIYFRVKRNFKSNNELLQAIEYSNIYKRRKIKIIDKIVVFLEMYSVVSETLKKGDITSKFDILRKIIRKCRFWTSWPIVEPINEIDKLYMYLRGLHFGRLSYLEPLLEMLEYDEDKDTIYIKRDNKTDPILGTNDGIH